ncbi:hypothetical protein ALC57_03706, partial [Trachymyrmex cornetzi]
SNHVYNVSPRFSHSQENEPLTMMNFTQRLLPFQLDNYESCPSWFSQFFTFASWSYLQDDYVQISSRSISDPSGRSEKHPRGTSRFHSAGLARGPRALEN